MKFATVLALLVGAVSALPVEVESVAIPVERDAPEARSAAEIQAAQEAEAQALFLSRNEVVDGDSSRCPRAVLIFARGSLELPNMGLLAGPLLAASLERQLGDSNVWVQGVGGPYQALLSPNFLPEGTNRQSIDEAKRLFRLAHSKCPNAKIFAAGYSQGTAVVGNAISELTGTVKDRIVGAALFGYTKNRQNNGVIPNFPKERTAVYCATFDAVCWGTLFILPDHFFYADEAAGPAASFLIAKL